jgi:hypothetical protein
MENAISVLKALYAAIEYQRERIPNADFDTVDWAGLLWQIQSQINQLQLMDSIEQFERMSESNMQALFNAITNGEPAGKITVSLTHTVSTIDTPRSLELKYGVPWQQILDYNHISSSDFKSQVTIQIPLPEELTPGPANGIPTFGDQSGYNILGTDIVDTLDIEDADFLVLDPVDSFAQCMKHLTNSARGDQPFYETYGLDLVANEQNPQAAQNSVLQLKIQQGYSSDPRVRQVDVVSITKTGVALSMEVRITPLVGSSITQNPST